MFVEMYYISNHVYGYYHTLERIKIKLICIYKNFHAQANEDITPNVPMRRKSPKTSSESPAKIQIQQVSKPEPKIGFSYKNDPHNTPTRHTTLPRTENISLVQTETPEPKSDTITTVNLNSNDLSRFRK